MPPSIAGGLIGGVTHSLLDAIMHVDVQPFRPFLDGNPPLRVISLTHLHLACVVAALVGAGLLLRRRVGSDAADDTEDADSVRHRMSSWKTGASTETFQRLMAGAS